jgi:hypothetical protein
MKAHKIVEQILKREGVTRYTLAKHLKGKVSQRSVYDFIAGKDVMVSTQAAIFEACHINVELWIGTNNQTSFELIVKNGWMYRPLGLKIEWLKKENAASQGPRRVRGFEDC